MRRESNPPAQAAGRRFTRGTFSAPIACLNGNHLSFETAVEISEGGLLLSTTNDYKVGEILELKFFIPGVTSFAANCEVAYVVAATSDGPVERFTGLRFLESNEHLSACIRSYVARD